MRKRWTCRMVFLAGLTLCAAASSHAQGLPPGAPVGSWRAVSATVKDATGQARDLVALGAALWLTIDADGSYVLVTQGPGEAVRESEAGTSRVVSGATIEFRQFGATAWTSFTFVVAGDSLTLGGRVPLDLDGDGRREPTDIELLLARQPAMTSEGDGVAGAWVRSAGRIRTYRMHVPSALPANGAAPLVLLFHGSPSNGRDIQLFTGFDAVADARGFVAVYPDGIAGSWGVGCDCTQADALGIDDVRLVRSLIEQLERERPVDARRVYAVGYSQGAMFSHRLACDLSDRLSAVAAVAGQLPWLVSSRCAPIHPISILMFHGTADPNVPWEGGPHLLSAPQAAERWAGLNGCAGKAVDPLPDLVVDGTTVTRESYANCAMDVETVLYTIDNGGHTWPGSPLVFPGQYGPTTRDIAASELIGELFSRHSLPPHLAVRVEPDGM